ncbi:hypothetical protein P148_SR1C00001G0571 [candidate division SR1 bacterium RAAC1_SR1_1]|nr:hypothetical protein P148_SR1C00001G0571 [candidate division SR1 bacterium RAAC1_SR1_1]
MTNNIKKIECFEKRVKTIEEHLAEVKQQVDADKRQKEQKEVSEDISLVKEEITEHLDELKKDVDENADEIKKLEDLSKKIDSFSTELDGLKDEILKKDEKKDDKEDEKKESDEEEKEGTPSFFANMFYGGLIANTLGNLPLIGKSIKSWTDKKLKESSQDAEDEESGKKEKPGFFKRIFKGILWSGIATGALWLGRKIIPDEWTKEVKSWFPWTDEAKAKKEEKEKAENKEENENSDKKNEEKNDQEQILPVDSDENKDQNLDSQNQVPAEDVELSDEEVGATQEVEKMIEEGNSEFYILMRMYQMGFVPKFDMGTWRGNTLKGRFSYILSGGPFTKYPDAALRKGVEIRSDVHSWMTKWLKESSLKQEFSLYKKDITAMLNDLETGKIKTLKDFEMKYGSSIAKKFGKNIAQIKTGVETESKKFEQTKKKIDTIETDIKEIHKKTQEQLKYLDNKAKNDPKNKEKYQKEAKEIIKQSNQKITKAEGTAGFELSKLTKAEILKLEKHSIFVTKTMKINSGIDNFMKKTKAGKFMIGGMLLGLAIEGANGTESWEDIGWQAGDLGVSLLPFVGGLYDIGTAIFDRSIASRDLTTKDRWIRAGVGLGSVVLDVAGIFSGGAGNAASLALKSSVKVGGRVAKVVKIVKASAEVVKLGMYGFLGYNLYTQVEPFVTDITERADKKLTPDIKVTPDKKED